MGFALAEECASRGAEVTLISGPTQLVARHNSIKQINVESAQEMLDAAIEAFPDMDGIILSAAVADYRPSTTSDEKIKREKSGILSLTLIPNPDIAATLGKIKKENQVIVGFALETTNEMANAHDKMERKNFDFIVLNSLRDEGAGFGHDTNKVTIISKSGKSKAFGLKSKEMVATDIVDLTFASFMNKID